MALDEAVARSVNTLTARHALLLPLLLWQRRPDLLHEVSAQISPEERASLDSPADRALAGDLFAQVGQTISPDEVAPDLSYSAARILKMSGRGVAKVRLDLMKTSEQSSDFAMLNHSSLIH